MCQHVAQDSADILGYHAACAVLIIVVLQWIAAGYLTAADDSPQLFSGKFRLLTADNLELQDSTRNSTFF